MGRINGSIQEGAILSLSSGQPLTITSSTSSIYQNTADTPVIVSDFPKNIGKVTRVSNGAIYFDGLQQVVDPARAGVTPSQSTQTAFSNRAIADAQGRLLLVNQAPGQLGSLGQRWIEGPGYVGLDVNMIKRVRIDESKEFEFRIDAINVLSEFRASSIGYQQYQLRPRHNCCRCFRGPVVGGQR